MGDARELYAALLRLGDEERVRARELFVGAGGAAARDAAGALAPRLTARPPGPHPERAGAILLLALGRLEAGAGGELGAHLDGCDSCRERYAEARDWKRAFQRHGAALLETAHPPPGAPDSDAVRSHLLLCAACDAARAAARPARPEGGLLAALRKGVRNLFRGGKGS
jgi:hypothetical protein